MIDLSKVLGFDWDEGNARKNEQHGVSMAEAEQLFFNSPLLVLSDTRHSEAEPRFQALGKTNEGRRLHISFTLRGGGESIRVISARDMHRKERAMKRHGRRDPPVTCAMEWSKNAREER